MSEEKAPLKQIIEEAGGLTDGVAEEMWSRFAPERVTTPPPEKPVPVRPLTEVTKDGGDHYDFDGLVDQIAAREITPDGLAFVDPAALRAAEEQATEEREKISYEWYLSEKISDPQSFEAKKAEIIEYLDSTFDAKEAAELKAKANSSPTAFRELYETIREKELAARIDRDRAEFPEHFRDFLSEEEQAHEAARVAAKEAVEKETRAKERLKTEMRSGDPAIRERATVRYFERFVNP